MVRRQSTSRSLGRRVRAAAVEGPGHGLHGRATAAAPRARRSRCGPPGARGLPGVLGDDPAQPDQRRHQSMSGCTASSISGSSSSWRSPRRSMASGCITWTTDGREVAADVAEPARDPRRRGTEAAAARRRRRARARASSRFWSSPLRPVLARRAGSPSARRPAAAEHQPPAGQPVARHLRSGSAVACGPTGHAHDGTSSPSRPATLATAGQRSLEVEVVVVGRRAGAVPPPRRRSRAPRSAPFGRLEARERPAQQRQQVLEDVARRSPRPSRRRSSSSAGSWRSSSASPDRKPSSHAAAVGVPECRRRGGGSGARPPRRWSMRPASSSSRLTRPATEPWTPSSATRRPPGPRPRARAVVVVEQGRARGRPPRCAARIAAAASSSRRRRRPAGRPDARTTTAVEHVAPRRRCRRRARRRSGRVRASGSTAPSSASDVVLPGPCAPSRLGDHRRRGRRAGRRAGSALDEPRQAWPGRRPSSAARRPWRRGRARDGGAVQAGLDDRDRELGLPLELPGLLERAGRAAGVGRRPQATPSSRSRWSSTDRASCASAAQVEDRRSASWRTA